VKLGRGGRAVDWEEGHDIRHLPGCMPADGGVSEIQGQRIGDRYSRKQCRKAG